MSITSWYNGIITKDNYVHLISTSLKNLDRDLVIARYTSTILDLNFYHKTLIALIYLSFSIIDFAHYCIEIVMQESKIDPPDSASLF